MLIMKLVIFVLNTLWATEKIQLSEGDRWPIRVPGAIWIENGQIIKLHNNSIQALAAGSSDLKIGKKEYFVQVINRKQNRTYQILKPSIKKTLDLNLNKSNGIISVTGKLLRMNDWQSLADACDLQDCDYQMRAQLSDDLKLKVQKIFNNKLKLFSLPPFKIEFTDKAQVHVSTNFPQLDKLKKEFKKYGITIVQDSSSIDLQPLIKVQITIAEIKHEESIKYGIKWSDTYSAQVLPKLKDPLSPLTATFQSYEKLGIGKVLASPNILCRSGKEAEFMAGGEFPIKIITSRMQDVIWKKYGVLLKVKPQADFSGRMRISIFTEISSFDNSTKVDDIPGLFTNKVQSHFDLSGPQTIALSGLIKNENSQTSEGLPGLTRIPILGGLFGSKDFLEKKSELIIFVRPEVVSEEENI